MKEERFDTESIKDKGWNINGIVIWCYISRLILICDLVKDQNSMSLYHIQMIYPCTLNLFIHIIYSQHNAKRMQMSGNQNDFGGYTEKESYVEYRNDPFKL